MKPNEIQVTCFQSIYDKDSPEYISLGDALKNIKRGNSQQLVEELRDTGDKQKKLQLPVVLFSGTFSTRRDDDIFEHSRLVVIDLDNVDVESVKRQLGTDDYVFSCWASPSGNGVKALVQISNPERHEDHFRALEKYFEKTYGLEVDGTGKNLSRACFESYDPELIVQMGAKVFSAFITDHEATKVEVNEDYVFTDYMKLNLAARMVRRAEDGHRHNTLLKASILCGGYISAGRMEEEEVKRVLFREFSKREFDTHYDPMATIADGIAKGKTMPIHEIIDQEDKARREMLINDGDMSFVSSDDEDFRWICDFAEGKIEAGLDTGSEILDGFWRYKQNFTIINGHSNVGKTTFALYLIVNSAIRHGWKWIIYSSENRTASIKMKLMSFCCNMDVKDMSFAQRKIAYEWVSQHFVLISNKQVYSYYDLIIFGEKLLNKGGFHGYFIDPYNSLRIDMSERSGLSTHEYHYEAASEFLTFTNNHDIAVWLNMHAVTEAQRRKGADGLPVAPYAEDTEGGGKHVNRSDDFLTFHRKVQAQDPIDRRTIEFHVRKIREVETGGQPSPVDEPIRFQMNLHNTGFVDAYGKPLFKSILEQRAESVQTEIIDPNSAF
jgi:hypothetical protein|tara:strand:+ start:254 stop:2077 length:1824 start_codon:yes stop_codon:yes gene_type:complete